MLIRRPGLVCLGLVALLAAFIPIQQQILRHRAENLLADVRRIQLRKSTWADAQSIFMRWGAWGDSSGACTKENCTYQIEMLDGLSAFLRSRGSLYQPTLKRTYEFLGGRPVTISVHLRVIDGLIWGKSFKAIVYVPAESAEDDGYDLIGDAESVSRFSPVHGLALALHKNYVVWRPGGCTFCLAVYLNFTPYADNADVDRLMDFNLSCITRRRACRVEREIMPAASGKYKAELPWISRRWDKVPPGGFALDVLGRDAENAAVVEVVSSRKSDGASDYQAQLRLLKRLKGAAFWGINATREVAVSEEVHRPGSRYVILFHGGQGKVTLWLSPGGEIALTPENLAALQKGFDEDFEHKRSAAAP